MAEFALCPCYTAEGRTRSVDCGRSPGIWAVLGHGDQNHDTGEDHQVYIEQDEDPGVVEAPSAAQATGRLRHAPCGNQEGQKLPIRAVQIVDVWEAGEAQAGGKCAQGKEHGAQQRFLPQTEDVRAKAHHLSLYRDGMQ